MTTLSQECQRATVQFGEWVVVTSRKILCGIEKQSPETMVVEAAAAAKPPSSCKSALREKQVKMNIKKITIKSLL